jgi:dihydrofolate reductase
LRERLAQIIKVIYAYYQGRRKKIYLSGVNVQLSIISAIDKNRVIGMNNQLPWSLPADLLRFKRITWGKPVIMGKNTFNAIGKPLPGRQNIILSRNKLEQPGCLVFNSLQQALELVRDEKEIFIIGGENLYQQTIHLADRLYLTIIHHQFEGDSFFPEWNYEDWEIIQQEEFIPDSKNKYSHTFQILKRKPITVGSQIGYRI